MSMKSNFTVTLLAQSNVAGHSRRLLMSHFQKEAVIVVFAVTIQAEFKLRRRTGPFRVCVVEYQPALFKLWV